MSEREYKILRSIAENFPRLSEYSKGFVYGYIVGKEQEIVIKSRECVTVVEKIKSEKEEKKNDD